MSGVTLNHSESDVEPECIVTFGGGRLTAEGLTDSRRIDVTFMMCYYARLGPHDDSETVESIGYKIEPAYDGDMANYLDWRQKMWMETGMCPHSGFYVAKESEWLATLPSFYRHRSQHYVVDGRDGYVELLARSFSWREWMWTSGHRDRASEGPVVGCGEGFM